VEPTFSIVIPAHDEEGYLGPTLAAIGAQTRQDFETIVVANGCTDRTAEIAEPHARVIRVERPDMTVARNVGARAARGRVLVFLDADVLLPPRALERLAAEFGADCALATFEARPSGTRLWYRVLFACHNLVYRLGLYRSTWGVLVCPRELFFRVGEFDPARFPQEHRDLARRLLRRGRYRVFRERITVSIRRYEQWGMVRFCGYWAWTYLRSFAGKYAAADDYEAVR
jgi:glycosyltransferase involved in cell wall biosynthesis